MGRNKNDVGFYTNADVRALSNARQNVEKFCVVCVP